MGSPCAADRARVVVSPEERWQAKIPWWRRQGKGRCQHGAAARRNCRYCGKAGHWAKECRKAARDREKRGEVANVVVAEEEEGPGLLMAQVCSLTQISGDTGVQEVNLNEERVIPVRHHQVSGTWTLVQAAT
jgi:hypothetical protein